MMFSLLQPIREIMKRMKPMKSPPQRLIIKASDRCTLDEQDDAEGARQTLVTRRLSEGWRLVGAPWREEQTHGETVDFTWCQEMVKNDG